MQKKLLGFLLIALMAMSTAYGGTILTLMDYNQYDSEVDLYIQDDNPETYRYRVNYSQKEGVFGDAEMGTIFSATTHVTLSGLKEGTWYFVVRGEDINGFGGGFSNIVTANVILPDVPIAPYPVLSVNNDYTVTIKWNDVVANYYKIEWCQDQYFFYGQTFSKTIAGEQTSETLTLDNGRWYFRIYAYSNEGEEGSPNYTYPHVVVDKPNNSHLLFTWFTDNDWWKSKIFVKLPEDANQATIKVIATEQNGLQVNYTIPLDGDLAKKGYTYAFTPKDLFYGIIQSGSIEVVSSTVGLQGTIEVSTPQGDLVDAYNAVEERELKTKYEFPALTLSKKGEPIIDSEGNEIDTSQNLAFAIKNMVDEVNTISVVIKATAIKEVDGKIINTKLDDLQYQGTLEPNQVIAWTETPLSFVAKWVDNYDYVICNYSWKSDDGKPFYIVGSNQNATGKFASWINPK